MIVTANRIAPALLALSLASTAAHAEIHKCRQGERVIYQETPCPTGSLSLTPPEALPRPSAFDVEEARVRAKNDLGAAEALRKREEKAAKAQAKNRADARTRESDCARLLDKIEKAEAKAELGKSKKTTLKSDQRKYQKVCGPL
jgi:hypothetical protein